MNHWKAYYEKTKQDPPRPLLIKALPFVHTRGHALDIGAGALSDSKYLLLEGFKQVTALDKESVSEAVRQAVTDSTFEYITFSFEDFVFPLTTYDFITAQYSLLFIHPSEFSRVFQSILQSLKTRGIFTGQLFGDRDEWKNIPIMTFHALEQATKLLEGMKIIHFEEEEQNKKTAMGKLKHWHVFHFIIEK